MTVEPYSALAAGYDDVMDHVDYDAWAAYLYALLRRHGDDVTRIVELGGGTGSLAVRLQPLGAYDYVLTDGAPAMLERARSKVDAEAEASIPCRQVDFTDVTPDAVGLSAPVDAVLLVYDGLNYLLDASEVAALLGGIHGLLRPGGLAIVDQATPVNSQLQDGAFVDEGSIDGFSYVRESEYDPDTGHHETTFDLVVEGEHLQERHVQRAYAQEEIRAVVDASPLAVEAAYDGLTREPAHEESTRIHWVLHRPAA